MKRSPSGEPSSALSPWQAGLRFGLELLALVCWGLVGWSIGGSIVRVVLAVVLPLTAAAIWGTFRVPGDESASGEAPVPVAGVVRLIVELILLVVPAVLALVVGRRFIGALLLVGVLGHYAATVRRTRWLLAR